MTKWHLARWIYTAFRSKFFHCRGVLRMTRDGSCMPDALFSPWTGAEVHWCICHLHVCKYSMTTTSISLNSLPFPIATTPQPSRGSVQTAKGRSSFPGSLEARLIFSWIKVEISPMVKKKKILLQPLGWSSNISKAGRKTFTKGNKKELQPVASQPPQGSLPLTAEPNLLHLASFEFTQGEHNQ